MTLRSSVTLVAAGLSLISQPALSAEVTLWMTGDAFEGGPAFSATLGEANIGSGTVDPIPSDPAGTPFKFQVADKILAAGGDLSIRITNDKYKEGVGDRNLRVVSAKVGGSELVTSDFVVLFEGAPAAKARAGEIPSDSFLAVASEPAGGWVVERLCDEQVAVTGYVNGALEPSIEQQKVLAPLLSQALAGECDLSALGYADTGGPDDLNRTVSEARAQAVAKYLADKGAKFRSTFVVGKGETTEFGPSNSANRRVVVSLK